MQNIKNVQGCVTAIQSLLPQSFSPKIGIVLGTGLSNLVRLLDKPDKPHTIPYAGLPGMPVSTVQSHQGAFIAGAISGIPVLLQQGRCHLYEGASPAEVCMGVRVMASLGIGALIITNAAGAINPLFNAGDLMAITDHINMTGQSPLTGPNEDAFGPRFPDMSRVYDQKLLDIARAHALSQGLALEQGVYIGVAGPQLETPAETRAYRMLGGDAIGMSTVLEAIAAHHMGLRILGISCLTNKNLPDCMEKADIDGIIATAQDAGERLAKLLAAAMPNIAGLCG